MAKIPEESMKQAEEAYRKLELSRRFDVVEFHGDVPFFVLFGNETQEKAAKITYMLNVGMRPSARAHGFHYEMKPHALRARSVREQLTEWISTGAIADLLLENLAERGLPVTVDNAKKLWYATLEGLSDLVREAPDRRITEGPEIAEQDVESLKRARP